MRYLACVTALLLLIMTLAGCTGAPTAAAAETPAPVTLPNPVTVTDLDGLAEMGLPLEPPEDATNISCSIVSDEIAQLQFELSGHEYVYRASRTETDIAGVYERFLDEELSVECDYDDFSLSITVKSIAGGGELGSWTSDGVTFTLYVRSASGTQEHAELCAKLGEAAHYAITGSGIEPEVTAQYLRDTFSIYADAPEGSTDVSYSIYDESIAKIDFTYEGVRYELTAAIHPKVAATAATFLRYETAEVATDDFSGEMTLRYNDLADAAVLWSMDKLSCCLYTTQYSSTDKMMSLALRIAMDAQGLMK